MTTHETPKRNWLVVDFEVAKASEEMASWLMMQLGANGCEVHGIEGTEERVRLHATFEEDKLGEGDVQRLNASLDEYGLASSIASLRLSKLEESDWLAKWKEGFEPFPIGEHFIICPPWLEETLTLEQTASRMVILIEPGLAFGTGFHATTQFCLKSLEAEAPKRHKVVDVGTGSGILAIGFAFLNKTAEIYAVETDPLACKVARENFELNGVADRIKLIEGSTETLSAPEFAGSFDLILSNLTYEDIRALLPDYVKLAKPGANILMAGILKEKLPLLEKDLAGTNLKVTTQELNDMWAGLVVSVPA